MRSSARSLGIGLVEVLISLAILTLGFFPLFALLRENRQESIDAGTFLELLDKTEEAAATASSEDGQKGESSQREVTVQEGERALHRQTGRIDPHASYAPRVESRGQTPR